VIRLRPEHKDHVWAYEFVHARTDDGRAIRLLKLVDKYTRKCPAIDMARGMTSEDVLECLAWLFVTRGEPKHIRTDDGS